MNCIGNIFASDGRAFVLAVDHPLTMPSPDLSDAASVIGNAIEGGVDAFLASYGLLRHFDFGGRGKILRADGGAVMTGCMAGSGRAGASGVSGGPMRPVGALELLYGADDALRVGADAMMCMGYPGSEVNASTVGNVAAVACDAHSAGLACGAEMLPWGFEHPEGIDTRSVEAVSFACRLGAELGADFIKTEFVGGERFREVVSGCYVPVLVLGGGKSREESEILSSVREAMRCGAAGVIMGRNIVRSPHMTSLCREISAIVHNE